MGIDIDTFWRWKSDAEEAVQVSLDQPASTKNGNSVNQGDVLEGTSGLAIEDLLNHEQEVHVLREEIMRLKERERVVLSLYYFEELKLREIAQVLGLTESRVSQIRSKAVSTLRERMTRLRETIPVTDEAA
jgi:RNA polymerase sigma factor for flagellar operon FliA